MADVFISYAAEDRETAAALAHALEAETWSVWWDRTILPGQVFDTTIRAALEEANSVVVLWSTTSVDSDWVKDEAAHARERGILVPAMIEEVEIPLGFGRIQTADLHSWEGSRHDDRYRQLTAAIENTVASHPAPAEAAQQASPIPPEQDARTPDAEAPPPEPSTSTPLPPVDTPAPPKAEESQQQAWRRDGRLPWLVGAAGLAVAIVAVVLVVASGSDSEPTGPTEPTTSAAGGPDGTDAPNDGSSTTATRPSAVAAAEPAIEAEVPGLSYPVAVATGQESVWVTNLVIGAVSRIDQETNEVAATISIGSQADGIAYDAANRAVWVVAPAEERVVRLDVTSGEVDGEIVLPDGDWLKVAAGDEGVWVASAMGSVAQIDPSGDVAALYDVPGTLVDIAVGAGSIWTSSGGFLLPSGDDCSPSDDRILRIDPGTGAVDEITVGKCPIGIAVEGQDVWIAVRAEDVVVRLDATTNTVTDRIPVGSGPDGVAIDLNGRVWVTNLDDNSVTRIDPDTLETITLAVGDSPDGVAASVEAVWVANSGAGVGELGEDDTVTRIFPGT